MNHEIQIIDENGKERDLAFSLVLTPSLIDNPTWKFKEKGTKSVESYMFCKIQKVADDKWQARKKILLQEKGTDAQIERYELLASAAERGEYDNDENAMILAKRDALKEAELGFMNMIEVVRKYLNNLVETGQVEKAQQKLEIAKNMGADVTPSDIANFMK